MNKGVFTIIKLTLLFAAVLLQSCAVDEDKKEPDEEPSAMLIPEERQTEEVKKEEEIKESELEKYAFVMNKIEELKEESQKKTEEIKKDAGFEEGRFQEIQKALENENKNKIPKEEKKKFEKVKRKIEKMHGRMENMREKIKIESGLGEKGFKKISENLQQNEDLRQRYADIADQDN